MKPIQLSANKYKNTNSNKEYTSIEESDMMKAVKEGKHLRTRSLIISLAIGFIGLVCILASIVHISVDMVKDTCTLVIINFLSFGLKISLGFLFLGCGFWTWRE
jgi:hypothetical protein